MSNTSSSELKQVFPLSFPINGIKLIRAWLKDATDEISTSENTDSFTASHLIKIMIMFLERIPLSKDDILDTKIGKIVYKCSESVGSGRMLLLHALARILTNHFIDADLVFTEEARKLAESYGDILCKVYPGIAF